ncbi:MAG: glycosyltransferase family 2 protein [Bacteroidetes bacterium]|nr:glycosyltransferase family 2 protein [Bacteroidota bacterium]
MKNKPRVSVILLNMNQPALTVACVESLQRCTYPNLEIIIVDQASKDNSVELLRRQFPSVNLIASKINLGFTGGNNLGMLSSTGDYFFLLNNDTEVDPGFLEPLIDALEADPSAGAASPLIRFYQDKNKIQYAGGPAKIDLIRGRNSWRGWMTDYPGNFRTTESTTAAHGAAFIIKVKAASEVGLLDDNFFIYFEELDWSLRLTKGGYKILFVPASEVFHKESMTMPKEHPFRVRQMTRNRILLSRKHLNKLVFGISLAYASLISFPRNCMRYVMSRNKELLKAYTKGFYQGLINQ